MLTRQTKRKLSLIVIMMLLFGMMLPGASWAFTIKNLDYNGTSVTGTVYGTQQDVGSVVYGVYVQAYSSNNYKWSDLLSVQDFTYSVSDLVYSAPFTIDWAKSSVAQTVYAAIYDSSQQTDLYDSVVDDVYATIPASTSSGGTTSGGGSPATTPTTYPSAPTAPVSQSVSAKTGATVATADGTVSVTLPAGAISGDGTLSITEVAQGEVPAASAGSIALQIGSKIFEVTLTGAKLTGDVTLTFAFDTAKLAGIPADQIGLYYYSEARQGWVFVGGDVNSATGKVTANVNHFTKFAVMANTNLPVLKDVASHWAAKDIKRLVGMMAIGGYPDKSFKPDNNITRNEFAVILAKALAWDANASAASKFTDSSAIPAWAKGSVGAAVAKGVINGYTDGTFGGDHLITRSEIAAMVVKALGKTASNTQLTFADASDTPAWAKGAIATAVAEGVVKGMPGNVFKPNAKATRAESSTMIVRVLNNLKI